MKISMIIILIFSSICAKATVALSRFEINPSYLSNGRLQVNNISSSTTFKFQVQILRGLVGSTFEPGDCTITLIYTVSPNNIEEATESLNYESDASTIELTDPKNITSSDYQNALATFDASNPITAVLPAGKLAGRIILRFKYYDSALARYITKYSSTRYRIGQLYVTPEIENNIISFSSGDPSFFDDFTISGSQPNGGDGTYQTSWQLLNDLSATSNVFVQGVTSTADLWQKDNTNYLPINGSSQNESVYIRRKITSAGKISYSNKILLYNNSTANKGDLIIKAKGRITKYFADGSTEKIETEIDASLITLGFLLYYDPDLLPKTTFRIENYVSGVRYKWAHYNYNLMSIQDGTSINIPVYAPLYANLRQKAYLLMLYGSDGSYKVIPLWVAPYAF